MYILVWEFIIRTELAAEFEAVYGPEGEWARLFARAEGYVRTELLRDTAEEGRYLTVDHWASRAAYDKFRKQHESEYQALDNQCERLTSRETRVGEFDSAW